MIARWWSTGRRALAGRAHWAALVVALTMLRLLTDLGMGPDVATDAYLLTLAGLGIVWCGRVLVGAVSDETAQDPRLHRPPPERPPRLVGLEESVAWAARSAYVRDTRLRPDLRYAVADRLGRAGFYLGSHPDAPGLLGPATTALVSSTTVAEPGAGRPGFDEAQLTALATELSGLDERIEQHRHLRADQPYETGDAH